MDENFEEFEELKFTDREIFTKIWTSPKQVLQFIHKYQYEKNMYIILILIGIVNSLDRASLKNMGDTKSLTEILFISIAIGGLLGWISFYFYSSLVSWTGSWINGRGNQSSLYRIYTYSMIPAIFTLAFSFVQILFFGKDTFSSSFDINQENYVLMMIYYSTSLISFGLSIYSVALCVIGTSIVQEFSIGKAILNLVLPILILIVILAVIFLFLEIFE